MRIERVEVTSVELPYKKPLITATNSFVTAQGVLVRVIAYSAEGFGFADLFPRTGESLESCRYAIETVIKPRILGRDLRELAQLRKEIDRVIIGNLRAKAALETALYDALAKNLRAPLYLLLGGRLRNEIRIIKMLGLDSPEAMAEEAKRLVDQGFSALKIKMSGERDLDIRRLGLIRNKVGDQIFLKVDANEAYDAKTAIHVAKKLADLGVEIFEQPVPRSQIDALREVKRKSPIKIEADQTVRTAEEAYALVRSRIVDGINTSIQKSGGLNEVRRIAELCEMVGVHCALSNTAGSMVGDAAALHLAASVPGIAPLCEIGEFETISGDPFTGLKIENGALRVPDATGLGVFPKGSE
ncbi:MAG TPA: enolase C-terminal domain-like protein [Candidatus Acidoferrales bacterium]|nr:enolase C-terminal domain-like protein [Candidatus Acidoferrales bacterium]